MAGRNHMEILRDRIPWEPKIDPVKCIGCGECLGEFPASLRSGKNS